MKNHKEKSISGYLDVISYECIQKMKEQMEKNICKIKLGKTTGIGFFCKIPIPNKNEMLPVFITNNHIINEIVYIWTFFIFFLSVFGGFRINSYICKTYGNIIIKTYN